MSTQSQDLTKRLTASQTGVVKKDPGTTVAQYLEKMKDQIAKALPSHMDAARLSRIALTTIKNNPKLLECSIQSLMAGVMLSAQLGLEPGPLGHCYLIPYGREAQFQISYKGLMELARRSGTIESIEAHTVHEKDTFEIEFGLTPKLRHIPYLDGPRGKAKLYYALAKFKEGGSLPEFMTLEDIEAIRKRSKSGNNGPWVTDYHEMAKKTVIKRLAKNLPISVEFTNAVTQDGAVKVEIDEDMSFVPSTIDIDAEYTFTTEGDEIAAAIQGSNMEGEQ